ncbi:uncharacterized protein LOC133376739 [Rhineura floridana]|uniref:uncharacterized protein LOC133376739 n=1 Tax=Rhineura floridana TaxID=261503 RepID=UPI002AC85A48|nr:uncharacterized protein LOC133376739 [Rhineura floridana]
MEDLGHKLLLTGQQCLKLKMDIATKEIENIKNYITEVNTLLMLLLEEQSSLSLLVKNLRPPHKGEQHQKGPKGKNLKPICKRKKPKNTIKGISRRKSKMNFQRLFKILDKEEQLQQLLPKQCGPKAKVTSPADMEAAQDLQKEAPPACSSGNLSGTTLNNQTQKSVLRKTLSRSSGNVSRSNTELVSWNLKYNSDKLALLNLPWSRTKVSPDIWKQKICNFLLSLGLRIIWPDDITNVKFLYNSSPNSSVILTLNSSVMAARLFAKRAFLDNYGISVQRCFTNIAKPFPLFIRNVSSNNSSIIEKKNSSQRSENVSSCNKISTVSKKQLSNINQTLSKNPPKSSLPKEPKKPAAPISPLSLRQLEFASPNSINSIGSNFLTIDATTFHSSNSSIEASAHSLESANSNSIQEEFFDFTCEGEEELINSFPSFEDAEQTEICLSLLYVIHSAFEAELSCCMDDPCHLVRESQLFLISRSRQVLGFITVHNRGSKLSFDQKSSH